MWNKYISDFMQNIVTALHVFVFEKLERSRLLMLMCSANVACSMSVWKLGKLANYLKYKLFAIERLSSRNRQNKRHCTKQTNLIQLGMNGKWRCGVYHVCISLGQNNEEPYVLIQYGKTVMTLLRVLFSRYLGEGSLKKVLLHAEFLC